MPFIDAWMAKDIAEEIKKRQAQCKHEFEPEYIWYMKKEKSVCKYCGLHEDELQINGVH